MKCTHTLLVNFVIFVHVVETTYHVVSVSTMLSTRVLPPLPEEHMKLTTRFIVFAQDPGKYAKAWESLKACHGVVVPGGFGSRGLEGKIQAINYVR